MSKRPAASAASPDGSRKQIRLEVRSLDNVIFAAKDPDGKTFSDVLGAYISEQGQKSVLRCSSDYDYPFFRQKLFEKLQIPVVDTLYCSEEGFLPVHNAESFRIALSQIHEAVVTLPPHPQTGLPFLEISSTDPRMAIAPRAVSKSGPIQPSSVSPLVPPLAATNSAPVDATQDQHPIDIVDLTKDDDEQHQVEHSEALIGLDEEYERKVWSFACDFSGHDPKKTDASNPDHCHHFRGLGIAVKPHQLWAATRILFMYRFEKTFGILLADGMGVGKTLEGSCGIVLAYHIRLAAQEVRRDRRTGTGCHLVAGTPDNAQSPGCECPSGTYLRGFACPCVDRLPTAQLIKSGTLPRGPAVILVPPGLREQWYEQLCKYVSPVLLSGGGRQTEIWSVHTAADKVSNAVRDKHREVRFVTAGELRSDDITDSHWEWEPNATAGHRPFLRFTGRSQRDNSHIIMILPASAALTGIQRESTVNVECEGGSLEEPFFIKPGWVVIDEAHNHITGNTVLWQFIKKLVSRSGSPLYLISMSGTPIRRSPSALLPFFDAVTSASVRRWGKPPSYLPLEDFDRWVKESGWLVDRRDYVASDDTAKQTEYEKRFQECKRLGAKVLSPYIIQRHSHYSFFGHAVIPLPPMHVESVAFSVFPAAYLADIRSLVNLSKEQLDKRLENKITSWRASSHGARPTMESIISEMDRGFGTQGRFYDLGLCATFPGLARMLLHGQPCRFRVDDLRSNLNTISDADLRHHKLWPYLDAIRSGSCKMDFIHEKVQDMLRDDERHKDVDDNRPTLRKKIIIFTISPTTAFLVAIILRKELPHVRQTLVLATDAPAKRGTLYAPFCRLTDEETPEDKDPDDPLLLITTARIAGEGLNLTRASYVIMMEPAFAKQVEEQAFRRVHRYGQQATTHLFTLHSSWNAAEKIIKSRQHARSKLLQDESIWTVHDMRLE